jgi:hypothetical protein
MPEDEMDEFKNNSEAEPNPAGDKWQQAWIGHFSLLAAVFTVVFLTLYLTKDSWSPKVRTKKSDCLTNMKQIGLCFKLWAVDNNGQFPFHHGTNTGGTLEFCLMDGSGFDRNSFMHFKVMSNELGTTRILVCPEDHNRKFATNFSDLQAANVTYLLRTGPNVNETNETEILAVCPIDGNKVYCDGSVKAGK